MSSTDAFMPFSCGTKRYFVPAFRHVIDITTPAPRQSLVHHFGGCDQVMKGVLSVHRFHHRRRTGGPGGLRRSSAVRCAAGDLRQMCRHPPAPAIVWRDRSCDLRSDLDVGDVWPWRRYSGDMPLKSTGTNRRRKCSGDLRLPGQVLFETRDAASERFSSALANPDKLHVLLLP